MIKRFLKKIVHFILALLFCFGIPLLVKQFFLRPIRYKLIGDNVWGQLFQWGFSLALILVGYILFVRIFERRKAKELSCTSFLPGLLKGGLWGILSMGFILMVLTVLDIFSINGFISNPSDYQMLLLLFLLALTEELLYRGILYRLIENWINTVAALTVSSVIFGVMHITNDYFNVYSLISIIAGGVVLGLSYTLTKNLWIPIFAHFTWNYSQVLTGIRLSGMDDFNNLSVFESELSGSSLLTGGQFGIENSIVAILYLVFFSMLLGLILLKDIKINNRR